MQAIQSLGNYLRKYRKEEYNDPVDALREEYSFDTCYFIEFEIFGDNTIKYKHITSKPYDTAIVPKLLFKNFGAQSKNPAPVAKLSGSPKKEKYIRKRINKFFIEWLKRELKEQKEYVTEDDYAFLEQLCNSFTDNLEKIVGDFCELVEDATVKSLKESILTIKFQRNANDYYLRDISPFPNLFISRILKRHRKKSNFESFAENQLCSLCKKKQEEIYGCISDVYSFFTLDKKNFAPYFERSYGWKLFPVCKECIFDLEVGKKFIEENLKLNFNNYAQFMFIPKLVFKEGFDPSFIQLLEELKNISFISNDEIKRTLTEHSQFEEKLVNSIIKKKNTLLMFAQKEINEPLRQNHILISLIFYDEHQQSFKLLKTISDVHPSRFVSVATAIEDISDNEIFDDYSLDLALVMKKLYPMIIDGSKRYPNPSYLSMLESILYSTKVSYHALMKFVASLTRELMVERHLKKSKPLLYYEKNIHPVLKDLNINASYEYLINQIFKFILLLFKMDLLSIEGDNVSIEEKEKEIDQKINLKNKDKRKAILEEIFSTYKDFFNTPIKRAIFVLGTLTQLLMNIQYVNLSSTPFFNRLNGMKLNQRSIPKLVSEVQGKLREYGVSYSELEKLMSENFLASGSEWKITNDEISFIYTLGMNSAHKFKIEHEEEKNE